MIAGCVGVEHREDEVVAALRRLAWAPGPACQRVVAEGAVLGCVPPGGSLWVGGEEAGQVVCVFWGDLYERVEICALTDCRAEASDAEVAGHAYLRWGERFAQRLDGEFSCAVWDGRQKRLVLARDVMSRRSLFYAHTPDGLCFASEPSGLVGWRGVDARMDEEMIARMLALMPSPGRTLRRGIHTLAQGTVLVADAGKPERTLRVWDGAAVPEWRPKDVREYADALRSALLRGVAVRLPKDGLVGAHLSSGFDSSGVTALAAQVLAKQNRALVAYTSVPVHRTDATKILKNRFDDEWPLAAQVAAMYPNVEHVAMPSDGADWWESLDVPSRIAGGPMGFIRNSRWYYGILQDARRRGLVTMLEGQAGNLTSSYNGAFGLYDLRRKGRWGELAKAVRNRYRRGEPWKQVVENLWMPSLRTKALVQRIRRKKMPKLFDLTLMRKEFYEQSGIPQRSHSPLASTIEGDRRNGSAWRASILGMGDVSMMTSMALRVFGVRREDPTADRKLVELCLSIPDEAFAPGGVKRQLYRDAMRDDLPAELLDEPLRGLQSSDFLQMFGEWMPQWYEELARLEESPVVGKYIDLPRMRMLLEAWPEMMAGNKGAADTAYNYTFGGALSLGRYLRLEEESLL